MERKQLKKVVSGGVVGTRTLQAGDPLFKLHLGCSYCRVEPGDAGSMNSDWRSGGVGNLACLKCI